MNTSPEVSRGASMDVPARPRPIRRRARLVLLVCLVVSAAGAFAAPAGSIRQLLGERGAGAVPARSHAAGATGRASAAAAQGVPDVDDGRDFAGFYQETSAADLGETYRVGLRFQIINYSDADVSGATVSVVDRLRLNESLWSQEGVSVADRQSVRVAGDFNVPRSEYESWRNGAAPLLLIEYQNVRGERVQRAVELIQSSVEEVQQ